jgi:hypothetical protein
MGVDRVFTRVRSGVGNQKMFANLLLSCARTFWRVALEIWVLVLKHMASHKIMLMFGIHIGIIPNSTILAFPPEHLGVREDVWLAPLPASVCVIVLYHNITNILVTKHCLLLRRFSTGCVHTAEWKDIWKWAGRDVLVNRKGYGLSTNYPNIFFKSLGKTSNILSRDIRADGQR